MAPFYETCGIQSVLKVEIQYKILDDFIVRIIQESVMLSASIKHL